MTRDISTSIKTEFAKAELRLASFAELDFSSGWVRAWSGNYNITWDGSLWYGIGELAGISVIAEQAGVVATGLKLQLSGVDSSLISTVLTEEYQGRAAKVYEVPFDDSWKPIGTRSDVLRWIGIIDNMEIEDSGKTSVITVNCESLLRRLQDARRRRHTDQDQKNYAGSTDRGHEFVAAIQDVPINWGRADPRSSN